jgi:heptosyltransferase-1
MQSLSQVVHRLEPHRICIIKPSSLGDVAHSLPILPVLRKLFPLSHVTWVVNHAFRGLLEGHPDLDRVITYDRGGSGITPRGVASTAWLCRQLLTEKYDLTIDLQGLLRSGLMTGATRAQVRIGLADAREGAGCFYTHRVSAPRKEQHAVDRIMRVAEALGAEDPHPSFLVPVRASDETWAEDALCGVPRPRLVLNPGARWLTKRWPPVHFAEVARRAVAEFGAGIVVVGSADDRPLAEELARHLRPIRFLNLTGRTSLLQLAALSRRADLFLSNDTGPLHLAAAAGALVVGIYTCTDPGLTGPYGHRASVVRSCVWCAPSFRKTCVRLDCLVELSPDKVWSTIHTILAHPEAVPPSATTLRGPKRPMLTLLPGQAITAAHIII